jgi:hypothetical protein
MPKLGGKPQEEKTKNKQTRQKERNLSNWTDCLGQG